MRRKKPQIGDVYEIKIPRGLAYFQHTHEVEDGTQLIRVLPGVYSSRASDFAALSQQKELYFTLTVLVNALRKKEVELVSSQPVPDGSKQFPTMRRVAGRTRDGRINGWLIGNGSRLYTVQDIQRALHVRDLTAEQEKLSIASIWPISTLVAQIERGWRPEHSEELEEIDRQRSMELEAQTGESQRQKSRYIDHYLYFPKRSNAQRVADELRRRGWIVEVKLGADVKNWLILAKQPAPLERDIGDIREDLERLAHEFGGEYDGWGAGV